MEMKRDSVKKWMQIRTRQTGENLMWNWKEARCETGKKERKKERRESNVVAHWKERDLT